jgi:hypothetical protein
MASFDDSDDDGMDLYDPDDEGNGGEDLVNTSSMSDAVTALLVPIKPATPPSAPDSSSQVTSSLGPELAGGGGGPYVTDDEEMDIYDPDGDTSSKASSIAGGGGEVAPIASATSNTAAPSIPSPPPPPPQGIVSQPMPMVAEMADGVAKGPDTDDEALELYDPDGDSSSKASSLAVEETPTPMAVSVASKIAVYESLTAAPVPPPPPPKPQDMGSQPKSIVQELGVASGDHDTDGLELYDPDGDSSSKGSSLPAEEAPMASSTTVAMTSPSIPSPPPPTPTPQDIENVPSSIGPASGRADSGELELYDPDGDTSSKASSLPAEEVPMELDKPSPLKSDAFLPGTSTNAEEKSGGAPASSDDELELYDPDGDLGSKASSLPADEVLTLESLPAVPSPVTDATPTAPVTPAPPQAPAQSDDDLELYDPDGDSGSKASSLPEEENPPLESPVAVPRPAPQDIAIQPKSLAPEVGATSAPAKSDDEMELYDPDADSGSKASTLPADEAPTMESLPVVPDPQESVNQSRNVAPAEGAPALSDDDLELYDPDRDSGSKASTLPGDGGATLESVAAVPPPAALPQDISTKAMAISLALGSIDDGLDLYDPDGDSGSKTSSLHDEEAPSSPPSLPLPPQDVVDNPMSIAPDLGIATGGGKSEENALELYDPDGDSSSKDEQSPIIANSTTAIPPPPQGMSISVSKTTSKSSSTPQGGGGDMELYDPDDEFKAEEKEEERDDAPVPRATTTATSTSATGASMDAMEKGLNFEGSPSKPAPQAQSTAPVQESQESCKLTPIQIVVIVFVLILVIILGVTLGSNNDDSSDILPTIAPSLALLTPTTSPVDAPSSNVSTPTLGPTATTPTATPTSMSPTAYFDFDAFVTDLVTSLSGKDALEDNTSPQSQALTWMIQDDKVLRPVTTMNDMMNQTVLERYALTVLYYSTGGVAWYYPNNFLNANSSVCDWTLVERNGTEAATGDSRIACTAEGLVSRINLGTY